MIRLALKYYPVPPGVKEDLNFIKYHPADATLLATIENSGFLYAGGSGFGGAWSGLNYDQIDEEARYFLENSLWDGPERVKNELIAYINEWYDQEVYGESSSVSFNELSGAEIRNIASDYLRKQSYIGSLLSRAVYNEINDDLSTYLEQWYDDYLNSSEVKSMKAEINSIINNELDLILQEYNCKEYTMDETGVITAYFENINNDVLEELKTEFMKISDQIKAKVDSYMKDLDICLPNGFMFCGRIVGEFDIGIILDCVKIIKL